MERIMSTTTFYPSQSRTRVEADKLSFRDSRRWSWLHAALICLKDNEDAWYYIREPVYGVYSTD